MKVEKALKILSSSDFDSFIGEIEDPYFEVKGAPYHLSDVQQKQELAKDVCGFANSQGGVIIIGLETSINPEHPGEEVTRVRPFQEDLLNVKQYRDTLNSWVYPPISDLDVKWYPLKEDALRGIAAVIIPKQDNKFFPFLITRHIEDNGKINEIVFGFSQRRLDEVHHHSVQRLHHLIQQGLSNEGLSQRLETIENILMPQTVGIELPVSKGFEKVDKLENGIKVTDIMSAEEKRKEVISYRMKQALIDAELESKPVLVLYTMPVINTVVPDLFASRDSQVVSVLRNPPGLRVHGFDLQTDQEPKIIKGQLRRSFIPGYKLLEFWRDGVLIFTAIGDNDFLCWGKRRRISESLRINPIALIEATYLFCETARQLYFHTEPKNPRFRIGISLRNVIFDDTFCALSPREVGTIGWGFGNNLQRPPEENFSFDILWKDGESRPDRLSFLLVREIYSWYGFEYENIPYRKDVEGTTVIDVDTLKKI